MLTISISAYLAGAVCGDHCSTISDTTIMSSAGAHCDHVNHVSTQLPYCMLVAAVSLGGFILSGILPNWYIVFPATVTAMLLVMFIIRRRVRQKSESRSTAE